MSHRLAEGTPLIQTLLRGIPKDNIREWLTIMLQYSSDQTITLEQLQQLQCQFDNNPTLVTQIAPLFQYLPCPPLQQLLNNLNQEQEQIRKYIQRFDLDPMSGRCSPQEIERQFSTEHVLQVTTQIKDILGTTDFNTQDQFDFTQKLIYINSIGKDMPVFIGERKCVNLTQASRSDLHEYSNYLIDQLHSKDNLETERMQLILLAVMRELYFRSTGKFPRVTQIASLLLSMRHPNNLLMEIDTGEGKSITTALLAVWQWINHGTVTVDVCTANRDLVLQDYYQKGAVNFFDSMGIESSVVRSDSKIGTYKVGGINYSTVADLSIYSSRARIEGEDLKHDQHGNTLANDLILDESDFTILDDKTSFNYAMNAIDSDGGMNPYAWIYPLINEFINKPEFRNLKTQNGKLVWTSEDDIRELKIYLYEKANNIQQRNQLKTITDKKFDQWLNAACIADQKIAGQDFIIAHEERKIDGIKRIVAVAVPLIQNNPQNGATFSDGVQQFLSAKLNLNSQDLFPIDSEMLFVDTRSCKDFVDHYRKNGRILAISGTTGTREELIEQQFTLALHAFRVPPYEANKRQLIEPRVTQSSSKQLIAIKQTIDATVKSDSIPQPILLICKDINHARSMHANLSEYYRNKGYTVQLVTGEESDQERAACIAKAGKNNTITISTSLLGRGTDITPEHKNGLFAIQCYLDTDRPTRQNAGRVARNGKVGKYAAIYEQNDILHIHACDSLSKMSPKNRVKTLAAIQRKLNEENAIERHYIQAVGAIQQVLLNQFNNWYALLELIHETPLAKELKTRLLFMRESLINDITDQWKLRLDASDPRKQYMNPYVRRDKDGRLITIDLNQALTEFTNDAATLWSKYKENLQAIVKKTPELPKINELRAEHMLKVDIAQEVQFYQINLQKEQKQHVIAEKSSITHVRHALDADLAILQYDPTLTEDEKTEHQKKSTLFQLTLVQQEFNAVINALPCKQEIKEQLLIKDLTGPIEQQCTKITAAFVRFEKQFSENLSIKYRMQAPFIEFIAIPKEFIAIPEESATEITQLTNIFIDDAAIKIATDLENHFAWSKPGNRSWDYILERDAVKKAAKEILTATAALKAANNSEKKKDCMKMLYTILQQQSTKLSDIWIFSFGHECARTLINNSIKMIDSMEKIIDKPMACKTEVSEALVRTSSIKKVNKLLHTMHGTKALQDVMPALQEICKKNNTLYVVHELYSYLLNKDKIAFKDILKELEREIHDLENKNPELLQISPFLIMKQNQIQEKLANKLKLSGGSIKQCSLERGHTGYSEFYNLVIHVENALPEGFIMYTGHINDLQLELDAWQTNKTTFKTEKDALKKDFDYSLETMQAHESLKDDPTIPSIAQYNLLLKINIQTIDISQIDNNGFTDDIKSELKKIIPKTKDAQSQPSNPIASLLGRWRKKTIIASAEELKNSSHIIQALLDKQISNIIKAKSDAYQRFVAKNDKINKHIEFLETEIANERLKTGVAVRKFDTLDALLQFEINLKSAPAQITYDHKSQLENIRTTAQENASLQQQNRESSD